MDSTVFSLVRGFFLALLVPCWASGQIAWVRGNRLDESSVADEKRYEEKIVEEQNCSCSSRSSLGDKVRRWIDEVVDRDHFGDHICAVTDKAKEDDRYDPCDP